MRQIDEKIDRLHSFFYDNSDQPESEQVLARVVKLNEEVGELCEAVLDIRGEQRDKGKKIELNSEIADVIITTLLLAKMYKLDAWKEINTKLDSTIKNYDV